MFFGVSWYKHWYPDIDEMTGCIENKRCWFAAVSSGFQIPESAGGSVSVTSLVVKRGKLVIYSKTVQGQVAFQSRSIPMLPRQRAAFILFDGKRDVAEVLKATAGIGVTPDDVSQLVYLGLLTPPSSSVTAAPAAAVAPIMEAAATPQTEAALSFTADDHTTQSAQAHYLKAYPIATRLTAGLGLRGFRLNLAVEAANDLDKLKELAPKIRDAVGSEKFLELENALYY